MVLATDSACVVIANQRTGSCYRPYFQNRIAEIRDTMDKLKLMADEVEEVQHIAGEINPADILTRGEATGKDIVPGSSWLEGPQFLALPRQEWPLTANPKGSVPEAEIRVVAPIQAMEAATGLSDRLTLLLNNARSLDQVIGSTARVLRAMGSMRGTQCIPHPVSAQERLAAYRLLITHESNQSRKAFEEGKLASLKPVLQAGRVLCHGRIPTDTLAVLTGKTSLPVLMPSTKLAYLLMLKAHQEDHRRGVTDVIARTRREAWIVRARSLARSVVNACIECRKFAARTAEQLMAEVPRDYLRIAPAFSVVSLDMFGPYEVKGVGGHVRKMTKCWGLLYTCLASKAIAVWACPGYDTQTFLETHARHTAVYGNLQLIISDHGSQLIAASKDLRDWENVLEKTGRVGTSWKFTERGCAWRNGLSERAIGLVKSSLKRMEVNLRDLNLFQLETLFLRISMTVNRRPITVRVFSEADYHAITPADLLLGRASSLSEPKPNIDFWLEEREVGEWAAKGTEKISRILQAWWKDWIVKAFPLLLPRRKWSSEMRNVKTGDVVLLKYDSKFSEARYRLARVTEVFPDHHGVVRTVGVAVRDKRGLHRESQDVCRTTLDKMRIGVQRLVVILPMEEQLLSSGPPTVATCESGKSQSLI